MAHGEPHREGTPGTDGHATSRVLLALGVRLARSAAPSLLAALIGTLLLARLSPYVSPLEFTLLNVYLGARPPRPPSPDLVLVGVSRQEAERHEKKRRPDCACNAIPRGRLGEVLSRVKSARPAAILLDLSLRQLCPVPGHDAPLIAALREPGPVVIAARTDADTTRLYFNPPPAAFTQGAPISIASPVVFSPLGVVRGVSLLQIGRPEEQERQAHFPLQLEGVTLAPLSLAAEALFRGGSCDVPLPLRPDLVRCHGQTVPVWPGARIYLLEPFMSRLASSSYVMLINWTGPAGTFPAYALDSVLTAPPEQLRQWFAARIVLVGSIAERKPVPLRGRAPRVAAPYLDQSAEMGMSGLEVHANALDTLHQRRFLHTLPLGLVWLQVFVLSLLSAIAFRRYAGAPAMLLSLAEVGMLLLLGLWLVRHDLWIYVVIPTLALVTSGLISAFWQYAHSRAEAARLAREVQSRDITTETIVHDLKQPLAAISALAAAIRATQREAGGASPELLKRIQDQVETALVDIDDLLTASPARAIALQFRPFDLVALTRDLAVTHSVRSNHHRVEVITPTEELLLEGDPRYLGRALSNLLDNAIKYWPDGGTVVVEIAPVPDGALLRVIDHGLGMTAEQQTRIFQRFARAVSPDAGIPGTGIGLYSVKRIVEAHGGSITVRSAPSVGSVFTVVLPCQPVASPVQ